MHQNVTVLTNLRNSLQSNGMFSCKQHCNIVSQYCNIDIGRLLWAICKRDEQIASWYSQKICKQSLWLDYKKKGSTNPVAQTIWLASFLLMVQSQSFVYKSFVNYNLQFVLITCKLLRAISLSKLQCGGFFPNTIGRKPHVSLFNSTIFQHLL